jgi:hypothetical protein
MPSGPAPSALDLYVRVWGRNPDNFQSSPNALVPTVAQGKRVSLMVGCFAQQMRIDFNFSPVPSTRQGPNTTLELIDDTRQLHAELARLIDSVPGVIGTAPVVRVGLTLHFLTLTQSTEEANSILTGTIPSQYRTQIAKEEDFVFQINRPRPSRAIEGVRMNHLVKWSVDRFQVVNIAIPVGAPAVISGNMTSQQGQSYIAASVTFDNNNVPVDTPLDGNQQSSLLREALSAAEKTQRETDLGIEGFSDV